MPLVEAQNAGNDVRVVDLQFSREPAVNQTIIVTAYVETEFSATIEVDFTYGDGGGMASPETPAGQGHRLTRFLPSEGRYAFNLSVTPDFERRGAQEFVAVASSTGGLDPDLANNRAKATRLVRFAALNVTFDGVAPLDAAPYGARPLRFSIRNDGNAQDQPAASVLLDSPGWKIRSVADLPAIAPGGRAEGFVVVDSLTENASLPLGLNVTIASSIAPGTQVVARAPPLVSNETALLRNRQITLELEHSEIQGFPGEVVTTAMMLGNEGALPELVRAQVEGANGTVNASFDWSTWPSNVSKPILENGTLLVPLWPGESRRVDLRLVRAVNATAAVPLSILANSTNEPLYQTVFGENHRAQARIDVQAPHAVLDLTVTGPERAFPGDPVQYLVNLTNSGRVNVENLTLVLTTATTIGEVDREERVLRSLNATASATFVWQPDTADWGGTYVLTARTSANASDALGNLLAVASTAQLSVAAPHVALHAPATLTVVPGERLRLAGSEGGLSIENHGDHEVRLAIELRGEAPWLRSNWMLTLPPGATHALPLELDVPLYPAGSSFTAEIVARVQGRPEFDVRKTVVLVVNDTEGPILRLLSTSAEGRVGETVELGVEILDATGVSYAEAVVTLPDGTRSFLLLAPDPANASRFTARFTTTQPGTHSFVVNAEDSTESAHAAEPIRFVWRAQAAPYLGFQPAESGLLLSEPALALKEVVAGTTAALEADVGQGWYEVPPPYRIALPPVEGGRDVRLRSVSVDGRHWNSSLRVTLDLTPPQVSGARVVQSGSGEVELEARSEDAAEMFARFTTQAGPVDVPLAPSDGARFSARVSAPGSWTSVVVVARDLAGNEETVGVSDEATTPFAGLLAALAILTLCALARCRR